MNSPTTQRHSPTISKATNIGGKKMASNNNTPFQIYKSRPMDQTDWNDQ